MAYNELAYSVTIEDVYESGRTKNAQLNGTISRLIDMIEENNDKIINDFDIVLDENNQYSFTVEGKTLLRFLADIYGKPKTEDLEYAERTERQREVIQAILDKAKKANIATLNKAANTIFEEISTSMTFTEITELLTDVASYSIGETGGFPAEQYRATGDVHGASCVMSTDLTADVLSLHQFLFGDVGDYQPSSEVQSIAAKVHSDTGK